ncbi:MAG: preprotein translocase subunit SecG [Armatimonadetes bacterium]|nr:MAG: preprotein translocase subunit SecG [Armatimonadota bacterium]
MSDQIYNIIQLISGVILVILVLAQQRGAGLGSAFGGESSFYSTKRGLEKLLFYMTIIISVIFLTTSLIRIIIS